MDRGRGGQSFKDCKESEVGKDWIGLKDGEEGGLLAGKAEGMTAVGYHAELSRLGA